jgi:hypothetical protein
VRLARENRQPLPSWRWDSVIAFFDVASIRDKYRLHLLIFARVTVKARGTLHGHRFLLATV